jgi:environmental stress-induced protein Ves
MRGMITRSMARVVRRNEYRETAWRNGGGVTYEIAREPEGAADFSWRLSLARIDRNGPFSDFSGYQRALTLVSGAGCRLTGADAQLKELTEPGTTVLFPGRAAVTCELIAGPCFDLNLMVREPRGIASVDHFSLLAHQTEALAAGYAGAVFCLEGVVECLHMASGERATLAAHDTLIVAAADAGEWRLLRGDAESARVVVHAWRTGA